MRTRKLTKGRVPGAKFSIDTEKDEDLKKLRAQILKELEEKEKNNKEWYDKELDKNMNKR